MRICRDEQGVLVTITIAQVGRERKARLQDSPRLISAGRPKAKSSTLDGSAQIDCKLWTVERPPTPCKNFVCKVLTGPMSYAPPFGLCYHLALCAARGLMRCPWPYARPVALRAPPLPYALPKTTASLVERACFARAEAPTRSLRPSRRRQPSASARPPDARQGACEGGKGMLGRA